MRLDRVNRAGVFFVSCRLCCRACWSSASSRVSRLRSRRWAGSMSKLIPEASGIVKSRRYPGIFWVHNDSGNPPLLFAIRGDGRIVRQFRLGVPNIDWEDIAIDDQGHLYLGDIGNNTRALPLRAIYRIDEPDPGSPADKPVAASAVTFYALPAENRFDAESLFYDRGTAILVAKYLDGREAELFAVPLEPPSPLLRPAQPRSIGRLPGFTEPATGADLSADGTLLAVCSTAVTRVYRRDDVESPPGGSSPRSGTRPCRSRGSPGTGATWSWSPRGAGSIASPRRPGGPRRCGACRLAVATARAAARSRRQSAGSEVMAEAHDVVIVGGGVIGLSIAYALAREGIRPTVLDRRELGREASWAGAGLIPPVGRESLAAAAGRAAVVERASSTRAGRPRSRKRRASTSAIAAPAASTSPGPISKTRSCEPRPAAGGPKGSPTSGWRPATTRGSSRR